MVVTHFGGIHTYSDATDALQEITEMHKDKNDIYEIVIHSDDMEIHFADSQIPALREKVKEAFVRFDRGALAFVSTKDHIFGLCRQLEMTMDNERIAISVFRSEGLARKWIDEIRSVHEKK